MRTSLFVAFAFVACNHDAPRSNVQPTPEATTTASATAPTSSASSVASADAPCCEDGLTWSGCCSSPSQASSHRCGDPSPCKLQCAGQAHCDGTPMSGAESTCMVIGHVETRSCCKSVGDFPNTCFIGACGCASKDSHPVRVCVCNGAGCFDGSGCKPPTGGG